MANVVKRKYWQDTVNLLIGAALFLTPWAMDYDTVANPAWNAWISGAVIALLALLSRAAYAEWEGWLEILTGLWVAASPWVLGYSGTIHSNVTLTHAVLGILVAAIAASE